LFYLLLDEVQMIPSWEKVINAMLVDADVDITITGSNAYLLSAELSTLLSGRYVEIKVLSTLNRNCLINIFGLVDYPPSRC